MMKIISNEKSALDKYAARLITKTISKLDKAVITLALPGGRSVNGIFQQLIVEDINWQNIHIFLTDERIVPLDHKESNFRLLNENLLAELMANKQLPANNIHPFRTELRNTDQAIADYSRQLSGLNGYFDILLLSAGEDGHIASLFPDHTSIKSNAENYLYVNDSPKPPARRISLSRKLLLRTKTAILLFYGAAKQDALKKFMNNDIEPVSCPAKYCYKINDSYILTDLKII